METSPSENQKASPPARQTEPDDEANHVPPPRRSQRPKASHHHVHDRDRDHGDGVDGDDHDDDAPVKSPRSADTKAAPCPNKTKRRTPESFAEDHADQPSHGRCETSSTRMILRFL